MNFISAAPRTNVVDCQGTNKIRTSLKHYMKREGLQFYANITCDPNSIGPWQLVTFVRFCNNFNPSDETIVISDSDDEEGNLCLHFYKEQIRRILK